MAKPAFGGIGFYLVFLLSISTYFIVFSSGEETFNLQLAGIIGAVSLGFLLGLADDAYNTIPLLKFLAQIACGLILIATGTHINFFESDWLNYFFSLLWVVGLMNSINMLDNMDAVATVASLTAIFSMIVAFFFHGADTDIYFFILLCTSVSSLAFLIFNWHPSKMFMGDTGSQFLGVFLAAFSIKLLWNLPMETASSNISPLLLPLLAFLIPLCDTTTVFINRLSKGSSPFIGGKDHTTHYLSYFGWKDPQIAMGIAGIGFVSLLGTFLLLYTNVPAIYLSIFLFFYMAIVFGILFMLTRIKSPQKEI